LQATRKGSIMFVPPPKKMSVVFVKKRSKLYLEQKPETSFRRAQPAVGQAEVSC